MGTIVIKPGDLRKNSPKGEHISRIMFDDNEPPKNYIWGKPDGFLYQWNGIKWVLLNEMPNTPPPYYDIPIPRPNDQYISKGELDSRLKTLKTELVAYLNKVISIRNCSSAGEAAIEWVNENVVPDLRRLQEIDHDAFATKDELANALDDIDLSDLATKDELATAISGIASSEEIVNINNNINEISETLENSELVVSSALNDLNSRLIDLESIDHSNFITAETVASI